MWRLLYPLRYLTLKNAEKTRVDAVATLCLGMLLAGPFILLDGASFYRPNGFLDKILTLTSALTGFYVAALVAAATFAHPDLDRVIRSGPIALIEKDEDGRRVQTHLTRRQFACYVFGYLAFSALLTSILCAVLIGLSSTTTLNRTAEWFLYLRAGVIVFMSFVVAHLMTATGLGLYYLMDRLYRNDRTILTTKEEFREDFERRQSVKS